MFLADHLSSLCLPTHPELAHGYPPSLIRIPAPANDPRPRSARRGRTRVESAHARLVRVLQKLGQGLWRVTASEQEPWASGLYAGTRHRIIGRATGEAGPFLDSLGETSFTIAGHIVLDVTVERGRGGSVTIEALTMEEG